MKTILWIFSVVMSFGFAYTMQFTAATLSIGRELSDTNSATGFQNAITPPWQTNLAIFVYIACVAVIVIMWWQIGWLSALGSAAVIFIGSLLTKIILPKPYSIHYRNLISQSMCSRYANYTRDGDDMRAQAMKQLLIKAGLQPDMME